MRVHFLMLLILALGLVALNQSCVFNAKSTEEAVAKKAIADIYTKCGDFHYIGERHTEGGISDGTVHVIRYKDLKVESLPMKLSEVDKAKGIEWSSRVTVSWAAFQEVGIYKILFEKPEKTKLHEGDWTSAGERVCFFIKKKGSLELDQRPQDIDCFDIDPKYKIKDCSIISDLSLTK